MFRREAETAPGRTSLATVRAVVKMFELRKVVDFEPDTGHSQSDRQLAGVSQMVMSSFIEELIPGTVAHAPLDSATPWLYACSRNPCPSNADASIGFQARCLRKGPRVGTPWQVPGTQGTEALCAYMQAFMRS